MYSLEAEIKQLSREGQNIYNDIIVAKIWGGFVDYALPILVLLEKLNDCKALHISLRQYSFLKKMMVHQDKDEFDVSDEDSIIDRIIFERNYIRARVNTIEIIDNLPIINADLSNNLLSRLPFRDNFVVISLTGLSGRIAGRRNGGRTNR